MFISKWEQYMRCDGLPNAQDPADLRKYIHIWLENMEEFNRKEENWLLKTKEQSILTQDSKVPNMSLACLKQQQPKIGEIYAKKTKEVLGILDDIEEVLDSGHMKKSILDDLIKVIELKPNELGSILKMKNGNKSDVID